MGSTRGPGPYYPGLNIINVRLPLFVLVALSS